MSILTGLQTARELTSTSHEVKCLFWSKAGDWFLLPNNLEGSDFVQGVPSSAQPARLVSSVGGGFFLQKKGLLAKDSPIELDVVLNCCHGGPGEDGTLQSAFDLAGIRYSGPGLKNAYIGMDKFAFGSLLGAAGFPVLPRVLLAEDTKEIGFDGPYILKPRFGGSSVGIEVVDNIDTAKALLKSSVHFRAGMVVEPYRPESFDLNVGVRLFPTPQTSAIEKPIRAAGNDGKILGYKDKYIGGEGMVSAPRELPADIKPSDTELIKEMAIKIAEVIGLRGVQRIDFLSDGDTIYVNEVNTIPGSHSKHLWVEPAVSFGDLLEGMIQEATQKPTTHWTTSGADGSALRSAGSIAGKLS